MSRTSTVVRVLAVVLGLLLVGHAGAAPAGVAAPDPAPHRDRATASPDVRRAVFVGNNWDGTADVLAPGTFERLGPDRRGPRQGRPDARRSRRTPTGSPTSSPSARRSARATTSSSTTCTPQRRPAPVRVAARPSPTSSRSAWPPRRSCGASRSTATASDHMALSPDGRRVSSAPRRREWCTCSGSPTAGRSAASPPATRRTRASSSTAAGKILHASIGTVYTPLDHPRPTPRRGRGCSRSSTRAPTEVLRRFDVRKALDARG